VAQQAVSQQTVAELQNAIRQWERKSAQGAERSVSTGCPSLDELFPAQGIRQGSLIEWVGTDEAKGAVALSLIVGKVVVPPERPMILIDRQRELFPAALQAMGIDLTRLVLIHPKTERDALWACEESLRCPGVGLVWMDIGRLSGTIFRRLQLAAEEGQTIGFFVRPEAAVQQASWADARLTVRPVASGGASWQLQVEVASGQGWPKRSGCEVQIDNEQGTIHDVPPVDPANPLPVVP